MRGDLGQALQELQEVAKDIRSGNASGQYPLRYYVAAFYLSLGKLRDSREILQSMGGPGESGALIAWALGESGLRGRSWVASRPRIERPFFWRGLAWSQSPKK